MGLLLYTNGGHYLGALQGYPTFPIATYVNSCPADLNNDQVVSGIDLAELLANWNGTIHGDLNCDGIVDGLDLAMLLAAWGPCPPVCSSGASAPAGGESSSSASGSGTADAFLIWAQQATIDELLEWLHTGTWPGACVTD